MYSGTEIELVICGCGQPEHQILLYKYDGDDEVWFEVHLSKKSFFKRLAYGIRYILGYQSKTGAFSEVVLEKPQQEKIVRFLEENQNS